jgi:signal transduction histidine kinase
MQLEDLLVAKKPTYGELTKRVKELERKSSELNRMKEVLDESDARYKGVFTYTKNGIAVYRPVNNGADFIFLDFNRAAERIDKIKRKEVIGRSILEVFPGVKEFGFFQVLQKVWSTGKPERHPIALYKDERIVGWRDNFVYKLPSGEVVAVYSDETERKQAEEELRRAHDSLSKFSQELEKKVQERTRELQEQSEKLVEAERLAALGTMANRVAHELRNSITVVGGFARRVYEKTPDNDPNKKYLQMMVDEVKLLEHKVSKILRIENDT